MTLSDWDRTINPSSQTLSTEQAFGGSKSLKMDVESVNGAKIMKKETRDTRPKEGSIRTKLYPNPSTVAVFYYRNGGPSTDSQSMSVRINWGSGEIGLRVDNGTDRQLFTSSVELPPTGQWLDVEAIVWSGGGGSNSRIIVDGSQLGSDLSSKFDPDGGDWGIADFGGGSSFWDNTELYY